jgi:hypothetical protein
VSLTLSEDRLERDAPIQGGSNARKNRVSRIQPAFDLREVRLGNPGTLGQTLLRKTARQALRAQLIADMT